MKNIYLRTMVLLLALAAISVAVFCVVNQYTPDSKRKQYEQFLLGEYNKMPVSQVNSSENEEADQPEMAALQEFYMAVDPAEGRVPQERLQKAYTQTLAIQKDNLLKSGPRSLNWDIVPSNMGGRTRCITFDPNSNTGNRVWAGSVTGGLWYNNDITSQLSAWIPVDDFWPSLAISAITFDPNDPQTMYVGTGEAFTAIATYRESSGLGVGIFKSTDNGYTWNLLTSTADFKYVTDIEIRDENGTSVIYAGVVSGIYHGTVHQSQPSDGLYRSIDGGQSWIQVLPFIQGTSRPYSPADIEIGPEGRIYIGTMRNIDQQGGATILWSDSGVIGSWTIFDDYVSIIQQDPDYPIPCRVMLASAPSDPDVVYAVIGAGYINTDNGFVYSEGRHIARSGDGGVTWIDKPIPSGGNYFWATIAWHALTVSVDPNNANAVYIGGLDVYKSTNGGNDWTQVSDWTGMYWGGGDTYVHADIHDIDYKPGSSQELVVTSDGGVFYTNNATSSSPVFQQMNTSFGSLQFYSCAISPTAGDETYVGGLQDNGTLYYTGSPLTIFDMIDGGDGAYSFIDQNEPGIMITSVYYNQYSVFVDGQYYNSMSDWSSGTFVCPADYDYKLNVLYANACSFGGSYANYLLRIKNIPDYPSGQFINLNTGLDTYFSSVKYSPYSPIGTSTLFVGSVSGHLYKVLTAQTSPQVTEITGTSFPEANLSSIAIGRSEDTLLVTFSNYGVTSVWQTYDGGDTWQAKEGNLPDMPIRWALYHPSGSKYAMLGTELGIWTTSNLNESNVIWTPDNEGLANVRVDMLQMRVSDNTVIAATHGRGLATATWDIVSGINEPGQALSARIYPNPTTGKINIEIGKKDITDIRLSVINMAGQMICSKNITSVPGISTFTLDLTGLQAGEYMIQASAGKDSYTKKILITK
jgi:hypothetical protein